MVRHREPRRLAFIAAFAALLLAAPALAADTWITELADAPLVSPPFKRTFYAGEVLRIKVVPGTALKLSQSPGSKPGIVAIIPMKGQNRAGGKVILQNDPVVFTETVEESNELAAKVVTGMVKLEGDLDPMNEYEITEGNKAEIPVAPQTDSMARFVNVSDFRTSFTFSFLAGGEDVSKASEWDRSVTLDFRGSSKVKNWKSAADRLVVEVKKGKLLVKAGLPFAPKTAKPKDAKPAGAN